jgi:hypothetical protein
MSAFSSSASGLCAPPSSESADSGSNVISFFSTQSARSWSTHLRRRRRAKEITRVLAQSDFRNSATSRFAPAPRPSPKVRS